MILSISIIGAIINRIRGGEATDLLRNSGIIAKNKSVPFVKDFNDVVFGSLFTLAFTHSLSLQTLGIFVILFSAMRAGRSFGWGSYIGGIIDRKVSDRVDVEFISQFLLLKKDHPVLRETAALSVRGLMWSFFLFVGFCMVGEMTYCAYLSFFWILPLGLLMGPCYLLTCTVCEKFTFRGNGWQYGELLWGAVIWGGCAKFIMV
jgi:hypothetical protein